MFFDASAFPRDKIEELRRSADTGTSTVSSPCAVYLSPLRAFQSRLGLVASDVVVIALGTEAILVPHGGFGRLGESRLVLALALVAVFTFATRLCGLYSLQALQTLPRALTSAARTAFTGGLALAGLVAMAGAYMPASTIVLLTWIGTIACGFVVMRLAYFVLLGLFPATFKEKILLIGDAPEVRAIHAEVAEKRCQPSNVVGYVAIHDTLESTPYPKLGSLAAFDSLSGVAEVDRVIILGGGTDASFLDTLAPKLRATSFEVGIFLPSLTQLRVAKSYALSRYNTFLLQTPPLTAADRFLKRMEDLVLGSLLLLGSLPLMGLIAIAVKLDSPGPAIFTQRRWGFNRRSFDVYKFRTMRVDASDPFGGAQARPDDARFTRIGRFLRRTSLDELPQFFNVIRGDMSLIGPRPHAVAHNEYYAKAIDGYIARHHVRPGMSGWAQVNGCRGETRTLSAMQRRLDFDLNYIARWSISFDVYIFIRTLLVVLLGRNAY